MIDLMKLQEQSDARQEQLAATFATDVKMIADLIDGEDAEAAIATSLLRAIHDSGEVDLTGLRSLDHANRPAALRIIERFAGSSIRGLDGILSADQLDQITGKGSRPGF
jgi:hypothetical protein